MSTERWQRLEEIFSLAIDLPVTEQEEFIRNRCGKDLELYERLTAMLAADASPHPILDENAATLVHDDFDAGESWIGKRFGVYEITAQLGFGGMGVVLLGERADGAFSQKVAVKIIKRELGSPEILRRFANERRILARLNHPNIARLMGGGVTPDGIHYLTMEFIEGVPVDQYCDTHRLTIHERVKLFLKVCEAVAYAQRSLVIHRDLKPSNILVTGDGVVKLLDFGIAKALDPDLADSDQLKLTRTGMQLMTPSYASPEQIRCETITTASDVYSLGVVFYELLAGYPPYKIGSLNMAEIDKLLSTTQPLRPSAAATSLPVSPNMNRDETIRVPADIARLRRTEPRQLRRKLSGDLDNICLKMLRVDVDRRYQSADQLVDELNRHIEGRPVHARPDTIHYRISKLISRNKTTSAITAMMLCAIMVTVSYYTAQLAKQRDRARVEAGKATEIASFLTSIFNVADPSTSHGRSISARELLDSGATRLEHELSDQPATQTEMMHLLGSIYYNLALYDQSREVTLKSLRIRREHFGENNPDVAMSLFQLGMIEYSLGSLDSAESLYRQSLKIRRSYSGDMDSTVAEIKNDLGQVLRHLGRMDEAENYVRDALQTRRTLFGNYHKDVAHSLTHLGRLYWTRQDLDRAEPLLREAVQIYSDLLGRYHLETGASMSALASLLVDKGELHSAESLYLESLDIFSTLVGRGHVYTAGVIGSLGELALRDNRPGAADTLFRHTWEVYSTALPENHSNRATALAGIGRTFMARAEPDSAVPYLERALAVRRAFYGDNHWQTGITMIYLGECLATLGDTARAESLLVSGHSLLESQFGTDDMRTQSAAKSLVSLQEKRDHSKKGAGPL